ncbi:hypothetical protein EYF80_060065 [Liparis tanakae]|uniref:Uncharacterized protein n=1 Tax=Liparis tanakae TaxID=230148 RepID=A0A4Z2ELF1_9TELE|nr:hypothetical protein EYF80_060065 [Liparis tanakae]
MEVFNAASRENKDPDIGVVIILIFPCYNPVVTNKISSLCGCSGPALNRRAEQNLSPSSGLLAGRQTLI